MPELSVGIEARLPQGFQAGASEAGIKYQGRPDLALLYSEAPCQAAGVFTANRFKAAPVLLSRQRLRRGQARAIVANSGCANAATGESGLQDAREMATLAARKLGIAPQDMLVASTGVIGTHLPLERVRAGLEPLALSRTGHHDLARAIMTTDTVPKEVSVSGQGFTLWGVAKGAGMIHPDLATMLVFLATDAALEAVALKQALKTAVADSFNMLTVDGDTSPNDTVLLLANGLGARPEAGEFQDALNAVCVYLARSIARDGEGASRLIEVTVEGARTQAEARQAARTVAASSLVKTAVYGADPNWGRVLAALGRSGVALAVERVDLYLNDLCLFQDGQPQAFEREQGVQMLRAKEVSFRARLNLGQGQATAWGCDLTPDYVRINSDYTT